MLREPTPAPLDILPKQVGDFTFLEIFEPETTAKNYYFALYHNSKNEKAILKFWVKGLCAPYAKALLEKEALISEAIHEASRKNSVQLKTSGELIKVPEFIASKSEVGLVWLLHRFIAVSTPNVEIDPLTYAAIQEFCRLVGESNSLRSIGQKKSPFRFLAGFIFTSAYSYVKYPAMRPFIKGAWSQYCTMGVRELFRYSRYQFCHLDIRPNNLLAVGDKRYLIDFQFAAYTHPVFDIAYSYHRALYSTPADTSFVASLDTVMSSLSKSEKFLFLIIFIYGVCFDLTFEHEVPVDKNISVLEWLHKAMQI